MATYDEIRARMAAAFAASGPDARKPWREIARAEQVRPEGCEKFVLIGGRGSGKTRSGAEDCVERIQAGVQRIHVIAPTFADARDVCIEGESGLLACAPPGLVTKWNRSMGEFECSTGARGKVFAACEPDRLNGPQCFIAGTLVATPNGDVPIEQLTRGDLVLTRKGPHRVLENITRSAVIGHVSFDNGSELIGTADHPIYTSQGWMRLGCLRIHEQVCAINASNGAVSVGIATATAITNTVEPARLGARIETGCIARYGKRILAQSRRVTTYIIKTKTRRITLSPILSCGLKAITLPFTRSSAPIYSLIGPKNRQSLSFAPTVGRRWSASETRRTRDVRSVTACGQKRNEKQRRSVCAVGKSSSLASETIAASVASTWRQMAAGTVYCLKVEEAHEYFANGILVHNCGHLWADEFGLYYDTGAIDMALFGLRLGKEVSSCWTSTPKLTQSTKYVLALDGAVIRRMRMRDNAANLAPGVVEQLEKKYQGTNLGRAELDGEIIEAVEGALWSSALIDPYRVARLPDNIVKIAVGVDPSVSDPLRKKNPHKDPDECGIVIGAVADDFQGYVINDISAILSPDQWAKAVVGAYNYYEAGVISAEGNQGGELVAMVIRSVLPHANVQIVHASIGKRARAEPLAALYEQGRIHHVAAGGEDGQPSWEHLAPLEDEMCTWDASDPRMPSPNRIDALVWTFEALGLISAQGMRVSGGLRRNPNVNMGSTRRALSGNASIRTPWFARRKEALRNDDD